MWLPKQQVIAWHVHHTLIMVTMITCNQMRELWNYETMIMTQNISNSNKCVTKWFSIESVVNDFHNCYCIFCSFILMEKRTVKYWLDNVCDQCVKSKETLINKWNWSSNCRSLLTFYFKTSNQKRSIIGLYMEYTFEKWY